RMSLEVLAASGLKQCQQAQDQLEDAIGAVMKAEQQLRENAREVRSELQSCVSRQQEALRCREVWLLGQIELLEQVKTETLQQQLHQLHRLRGQFDVIAYQLQSSSSNDLNNQLTSCMEKLSSLSLTPEETPELSFHADSRSLKQAITSFGSINAQSSTHLRPQVQSCPITAKKQMAEPSSLSDWLLESQPANSFAPIGYQSSTDPQDWLLSQKESKTSCPVMASVNFMKAWGQLRDLEAWLIQDPSPNRERSVSSCSSSFSIEKIDEMELREENGSSSSLFQSPLETDLWLFPRKSPAPDSAVPPQEEEEEDKWLLRKRSQAQERLAVALPTMCDLFSCMKVGGDKEKWLHRSPIQVSHLHRVT
uniref:Nuclear receptor coactivator 4 n=1 Tax=Pundamilia nyererei TaxID=303518 RepID=A0A3B4EXF5_9CICH